MLKPSSRWRSVRRRRISQQELHLQPLAGFWMIFFPAVCVLVNLVAQTHQRPLVAVLGTSSRSEVMLLRLP